MTGTPARKSMMNYWHLLCWCLREKAPVPMTEGVARMWAMAIDEDRGPRPSPGPLGPTLKEAREWFRAAWGIGRVVDEDSCDAPLTVRIRGAGQLC
jgi:hypothetical protein